MSAFKRIEIAILCTVLVLSLIFLSSEPPKAVLSSKNLTPCDTIIIDAGHGGLTNTID